MLVPAIAAIPVALIVTRISPESQGAGVPQVMVAVETAGGFVRWVVAPAKLVATAFTIGGGGAAGREGPIVLIAGSVASVIGRVTRQPSAMLVLMVAAAAAGGISATFHTPIAGTFFALEVVLRRFNVRNFTIVVVSAVVANLVATAYRGEVADLGLPPFDTAGGWEVGLHALVGVAAAFVGIIFVRTRFFTEDVFDFAAVPRIMRPVLGLFGVGLLALIERDVLGSGLDQIGRLAAGDIAVSTLITLLVLKAVAASLTIGSGASGGAFAPLLFLGAVLGTLMETGFENALPEVVETPGSYAIVGMAAVFAAAARAPMTSLFIVFELTGYSLIIPLMAAVALATALAQLLTRDTIYNVRLRRAGLDVREEPAASPLDDLTVAGTMRTDTPIVDREATIQDLANAMSQSRGNVVAVADRANNFIGLVSATDVASAVEGGEMARTGARFGGRIAGHGASRRIAALRVVDAGRQRRAAAAGGGARKQAPSVGHADPARRAARTGASDRSFAVQRRIRTHAGAARGGGGADRGVGAARVALRRSAGVAAGAAGGGGGDRDLSTRRGGDSARQCGADGERPGGGPGGAQ